MARRQKPNTRYQRRQPVRQPYDVVLVVCEGTKTEPSYINALRNSLGLSSLNIRVLQPPGNDPMSIARFAIQQMEEDSDYDRAYCIFDSDQHANFLEAIRVIEASDFYRSERLIPIPSVPCFEVWMLLHYRYTSSGYMSSQGEPPCAKVIRDLRAYFPDYEKGHKNAYEKLSSMLNQAITHAERLEKHNIETKSSNPSTQMHHLIKYLRKIKAS